MKESSLVWLSRSFRYSLEFPVLPHSSLAFLATMQNQSTTLSISTPHQPQSVAALLPEEIVDAIFAQLGLDCSLDAKARDRMERYRNLSNISVVADGWTRPARTLLFRSVRIWSWSHLQEEVVEGLGKQVRDLEVNGDHWHAVTSQEAADAVFKLLKRLPSLRRLRLDSIPCRSSNPTDSSSMHATALLPHLHALSVSDSPFPHSLICDLLATSGHRIDRLYVHNASRVVPLYAIYRQLDFRGKLRFLSTGSSFYRTLVDPRLVAVEGLKGLEELQLQGIDRRSTEGGEEMYRVIGPTLSVLSIECDEVSWFADFLPLLSNLSRLSIAGFYSNPDPDPTPLLRCLPPSLSSLRLATDFHLGPTLARWNAAPSPVPAGLKQIHISDIGNSGTYQQLPPIPTLRTDYRSATPNLLRQLSPATVPFKTLEMWFHDYYLDQRTVVQAECSRLGVVFRQRIDHRDD